MLESGLRDHLAEQLVLLLLVLLANACDPGHKGLPFGTKRPSPADRHHEILLGCAILAEVTPPTEEVAQLQLCLTTSQSIEDFHGGNFIGVDPLAIQIELSPEEEELLAHLVGHIAINDGVSLVVLVYYIESLSIPDSEVEALAIHYVVAEDALQLVHFSLKVDHNFSC